MDGYRPFNVARLPEAHFGAGRIRELPDLIREHGRRVLLVTGRASFEQGPHWQPLLDGLAERGIGWEQIRIEDEPSPQLIDAAVAEFRGAGIEVVAAIGGGSTLDAAKAIAGLLGPGNSVMDHLEGVGPELPYRGPATPWIAVPTTAGTGSEATKNAVLSERGPKGFKKSFRHNLLVAQAAILDPGLLATCPKPQIAANGMDAFTQLLESYVSLNASPFTDVLAESGLRAFRDGFWPAWETDHPEAAAGYERLMYASWLSGITLAQAGLGSVHGLASPLGALFPIPHGVVCGTLVAEATAINIAALRQRRPDSPALARYARAAGILVGHHYPERDLALDALVRLLESWNRRLELPRLSVYGITEADFPAIIPGSRGSSMKTNPLVLEDGEIAELLRRRL